MGKIYFDPNIERKGAIINGHVSEVPLVNGVPSFSVVECNICGLCNRKCVFCPRHDPKLYPNKKEYMSISLYEKIMRDLHTIDYRGEVLFSGYCEPLMHPQLFELISLTKKYCSESKLEIVTNGDFLTTEKLDLFFESGLDNICVSLYDGPHQIAKFERMKQNAGLNNKQFILRIRYLPKEKHFGITMSNRAGLLNMGEIGIAPLRQPMRRSCYYPFYSFIIDCDGSVFLCPHDWIKKLKIGNLDEMSVFEVWNSDLMNGLRKRLIKRDRNFTPCKMCDVQGTLMGRKHFKLWKKYLEENF